MHESPFTDSKGYPICEGDILKCAHFRSRSRNHFMYKIASYVDGQWRAYSVTEVFTKGKADAHWCRLLAVITYGGCEIIDGHDRETPKHLPTYWYKRKKRKSDILQAPSTTTHEHLRP